MSCSRREVSPLLQELQEACRRPLFTEICLDDVSREESYRAQQRTIVPDSLLLSSPGGGGGGSSEDDGDDDGVTRAVSETDGKMSAADTASSLGIQNSGNEDSGRKRSWREVSCCWMNVFYIIAIYVG